MNCNVAWYLQSGDCAPMWAQVVFFACALVAGILWGELLVFKCRHVIRFLFLLLALVLAFACLTNNKKLIGAIEYILKQKQ